MTSDDYFLKAEHGQEAFYTLELALGVGDAVFSIDYCRKLDSEARGPSKTGDKLSQKDLKFLAARLTLYFWEYKPLFGSSESLTPKMKFNKIKRIKLLTESLLCEFGLVDYFISALPSPFHYEEGGIFYESKYDHSKLLRALQLIDLEADRTLSGYTKVKPQRGARPQPRMDILYRRLGYEFGRTWGSGAIAASRTDGRGGPSIRFIKSALQVITEEVFKPTAIYDQLRPLISEINNALATKDLFYEQVFQGSDALKEGGSSLK